MLWRFTPKIAVITGSVGKTSTKDAVATALSAGFTVRKSEKSYNSEIGVPLTILGLQNAWGNALLWLFNIILGFLKVFAFRYPKWLVLEVGADKPGDMDKIFSWLTPDIVIVTRFPDIPVHVEFYESPAALIEEESVPAYKVQKNGTFVLNYDDPKVMALKSDTSANVFSYGLTPGASVVGKGIATEYGMREEDIRTIEGMGFLVEDRAKNVSFPFTIKGAIGAQHIYPVLAAIATGLSQGIAVEKLAESFERHVTPNGRMKIIRGLRGTSIIDDTYNSSPVAVHEALRTLESIDGFDRTIVVLGDMLELGRFSKDEHRKVGTEAAQIADILVTVGLRSRDTADAALDAQMSENNIYQFDESREAARFVQEKIKTGDLILIKGSQGMRMERITEEIMAHPEIKEEILVRQDSAWRKK
jgi:UDP-N-acetylmuramoyl-tripeptide--D-alanyl-D-alanine ligase